MGAEKGSCFMGQLGELHICTSRYKMSTSILNFFPRCSSTFTSFAVFLAEPIQLCHQELSLYISDITMRALLCLMSMAAVAMTHEV